MRKGEEENWTCFVFLVNLLFSCKQCLCLLGFLFFALFLYLYLFFSKLGKAFLTFWFIFVVTILWCRILSHAK